LQVNCGKRLVTAAAKTVPDFADRLRHRTAADRDLPAVAGAPPLAARPQALGALAFGATFALSAMLTAAPAKADIVGGRAAAGQWGWPRCMQHGNARAAAAHVRPGPTAARKKSFA
jgi:hypothetical protein